MNGCLEEVRALRLEQTATSTGTRLGCSASEGTLVLSAPCADLGQQIQAFEQRSRLAIEALEEAQRRQVVRLRRAEHAVEDVLRRLAAVEEDLRLRPGLGEPESLQRLSGGLEARIGSLEQQQEQVDAEVQALQVQVEERFQVTGAGPDAEEAARAAERGLAELERRASGQIQDLAQSLASLRVKVDGQLHRVGTLAERLQTAHEPAVELLRSELAQATAQERHRVDGELAAVREGLQAAAEGSDEALEELRGALQQAQAQMIAALRPLDGRIAEVEAEVGSVALQTSRLTSHLLEVAQEATLAHAAVPCARQLAWDAEEPIFAAPAIVDMPSGASGLGSGSSGSEAPPPHAAGLAEQDSDAAAEELALRRELNVLAEQLYAADELAERVGRLQQHLGEPPSPEREPRTAAPAPAWEEAAEASPEPPDHGEGEEAEPGADAAPPLAERLHGLAQEVGGLQARLLAAQLGLQTRAEGAEEGAVPPRELEAAAERVAAAERELLGAAAGASGASGASSSAGASPRSAASAGPPGCQEAVGGGEAAGEPLAALAWKLDPLEEVLRLLARRLGALQRDLQTSGVETAAGDAGGTCDPAELPGACAGGAAFQVQLDDLHMRVAAVEVRLEMAEGNQAGFGDEDLRGEHGADSLMRPSVQDLAALHRDAEQTREAVTCLSQKVGVAERRLEAAEGEGRELRRELRGLRGRQAAGAWEGAGACAVAPQQLDALCEQVAELQLEVQGCRGLPVAGR